MIILTDLYSFMENVSNVYADLLFIEECSREEPDLYNLDQKIIIQEASKKFFAVMNSGATTDSLEQLTHLNGTYQEIINTLFQLANELEYEK